jgi:site-specific recombinase XerD
MTKAVRPCTVATYYGNLRTLFRFLVAEGVLDTSPVDSLRPPIARHDQVQPFTQDQVNALLTLAAYRASW